LVESYRRFMHTPKLLLFYEPAEWLRSIIHLYMAE
jgi:hypothetical protein